MSDLRLSPSFATTMLTRSSLHAWTESRQGGNERDDPTGAMLRGSLVDALFFNQEDKIVVGAFTTYQSNDAKKFKAEALEAGKVPVLQHKLDEWKPGIEKQLAELRTAYGIKIEGGLTHPELKWESDGVPCKCELDYFDDKKGIIYELKSTENAEPGHRGRNAMDAGQDIQCVSNIEAVEANYPQFLGRVKYFWMFLEPDAPHAVVVARPSQEILQLGQSRWARAKAEFKRCAKFGVWKGYTEPGEIVSLMPPTWALTAEFELEMSSSTGDDIRRAMG